MTELRRIPIEDVEDRDPEWEDIPLGYGQPPTLRKYQYDFVHDDVKVEGPIIAYDPPVKPAP